GRGLGHPRRGDPGASCIAEPRTDASSSRHSGVRAGARRGQGHPGAPARLSCVQRGLRRRPDGGPRAAVGRGAGRVPDPHALGELEGEYTTYHDFLNRTLSKKELGDFISILVDTYGAHAVASVLDTIKELGFIYATRAGVTISKNDIVIPPEKEKILGEYEE